ncbi:MAG: pantetheine-phosphate adenylyltransferase [Firmicutes bacterium]|nr:pantetheine-phosphate adenylyltransferase [Bacillota bacterium]
MKKVIFAGTFDPITLGHLDIIKQAARLFDTVVVAVAMGNNSDKRLELVKKAISGIGNVAAEVFDGMLVDYAKSKNITTLIRGIRNTIDFEYEKSLSQVYHSQDKNLQILYVISSLELSHISSSSVREIAKYGGNLTGYVPKEILKDVTKMH